MTQIIFFSLATLVNVILQTCKSVLTIRSTRQIASIINAIAFGFYTIVLKQIADTPLVTSVIITMIANYVGVQIALVIMEKTKKDKLWKISVTIKNVSQATSLIEELSANEMSFSAYSVSNKHGVATGIDIYSESQKDSAKIKKILAPYDVLYHVIETRGSL